MTDASFFFLTSEDQMSIAAIIKECTRKESECHIWIGWLDHGRPAFSYKNRHYLARRVLAGDKATEYIGTTCRNKRCVNPAHFICFPSRSAFLSYAASHKKQRSKLDAHKDLIIQMSAQGYSSRQIARRLGASGYNVARYIKRRGILKLKRPKHPPEVIKLVRKLRLEYTSMPRILIAVKQSERYELTIGQLKHMVKLYKMVRPDIVAKGWLLHAHHDRAWKFLHRIRRPYEKTTDEGFQIHSHKRMAEIITLARECNLKVVSVS